MFICYLLQIFLEVFITFQIFEIEKGLVIDSRDLSGRASCLNFNVHLFRRVLVVVAVLLEKNKIKNFSELWMMWFFRNEMLLVLCNHLSGQASLTRRTSKYGPALCFTSHVSCFSNISCSSTLRERIYLVSIHCVSMLDLLATINLYYSLCIMHSRYTHNQVVIKIWSENNTWQKLNIWSLENKTT